MAETEGPQMTSQQTLYAGSARLYVRMRMRTPTRPGTHTHTRTRTPAHTHKYVILIAFPQQQWFCKCASLLRYTYIACLVTKKCSLVRIQSLRHRELTLFSIKSNRLIKFRERVTGYWVKSKKHCTGKIDTFQK
jgi:hypothetical protein